MKKVSLKLNKDLGGKKAGTILALEIDANKVIVDRYWRRRLEDAAIDGCVEIVKAEKKNKGDE
jgi:hypothetical protein